MHAVAVCFGDRLFLSEHKIREHSEQAARQSSDPEPVHEINCCTITNTIWSENQFVNRMVESNPRMA